MKTDQDIKADVSAELMWDPAIDPANVGVAVRGIALDLDVRLAPDHKRTDPEIAQAALHALRWHSLVPPDQVKVEVEDGWVTLTGEIDWGYQSASAEQAVRPLVGVRGVTNQIRLKQRANPQDIRTGLVAALTRHARREARHIAVEVDGSVVTLRGKVDSLAEHDAVVGTAAHCRGVTRVVDDLEVGT